METSKRLTKLGWLPHIALFIVSAAILTVAVGILFGLLNQPAPQSEPTPYHIWTVMDATTSLQSAGLDVQIVRGGPKDDRDGFAAMTHAESVRFHSSSSNQPVDGMLVSFHNEADLQKARQYLLALNQALPEFTSWVYVQDNILVQLNGDIPQATAQRYRDALSDMAGR